MGARGLWRPPKPIADGDRSNSGGGRSLPNGALEGICERFPCNCAAGSGHDDDGDDNSGGCRPLNRGRDGGDDGDGRGGFAARKWVGGAGARMSFAW